MAKDILKRKNTAEIEGMTYEDLTKEFKRLQSLRNCNKRSRHVYQKAVFARLMKLFNVIKLLNT